MIIMASIAIIPVILFIGAIMLIPNGLNNAEAGGPLFPPDCSDASPSQDLLWPPNKKMKDITIEGVTSSQGHSITITIDTITQDEPTGKTIDGDGIGTDTAKIRAEHSGLGDGRVYEISFTAEDIVGLTCTGEVSVGVPHAKKHPAIDSGQNFDSTQ